MKMNVYESGRKVVLLKGDAGKWYEQAIFILRENTDYTEIDFVKEAERIINGQNFAGYAVEKYENAAAAPPMAPPRRQAQASERPKKKNKRRSFDKFLNIALIIAAAAVMILFYFNFMR